MLMGYKKWIGQNANKYGFEIEWFSQESIGCCSRARKLLIQCKQSRKRIGKGKQYELKSKMDVNRLMVLTVIAFNKRFLVTASRLQKYRTSILYANFGWGRSAALSSNFLNREMWSSSPWLGAAICCLFTQFLLWWHALISFCL